MTATITPHNARNLARTDPVARLHDYNEALSFYLGLIDRPLHGIVFVENSDSDVTTLRQLVASRGLTGRVEFLCNYGVHLYSEKGRAHGEFKLLDYAMASSVMVIDAGVNHVVWKITGRYTVKNLASMIASAPRGFDAYVDMKDHPRRWMDMRLMAWTSTGYDRIFRGVADDLDSRHTRCLCESTCRSGRRARAWFRASARNLSLMASAVGITTTTPRAANFLSAMYAG